MSNAGRVIQHEGRELGAEHHFPGGFFKTPIVSRDVPPIPAARRQDPAHGVISPAAPCPPRGYSANAGAAPGGAGASQAVPCPRGAPWEGISKPLPSGEDGDSFLLMLARYPGAVNTPSPTASAVTYLVYKIVL